MQGNPGWCFSPPSQSEEFTQQLQGVFSADVHLERFLC